MNAKARVGSLPLLILMVLLCVLILQLGPERQAAAQTPANLSFEVPTPSIINDLGYAALQDLSVHVPNGQQRMENAAIPNSPLGGFLGVNFDTNPTYNGSFYFIPPDPIAAAGPNHLVSVVNTMVAWYNKSGTTTSVQGLSTFFTSLSPQTFTFDPKVLYDQHHGRFVIITLERTPSPQTSRMFLAVSDDSNPNGTWYFQQINALQNIGGFNCWADYPGFAVGDNAIYITASMFDFSNNYCGVRLWIVNKGTVSGLYAGGTSGFTVHDPPTAAGGGAVATTTQPAHTFGTLPGNTGTYLVQYSGLSAGGNEFLGVYRVDDPLGTPVISHQFVPLGNIDSLGAMQDAPQLGTTTRIETNDRRALNAVWRNNTLYLATTIEPNAGPDIGQTTAYWVEVDTTIPSALTVNQQVPVGAEDLGTGTFTYFPSLMVDNAGNVGLSFSASSATIYPGAYATRQHVNDTAGTVRGTETIQAGLDYYVRLFAGDTRNRWGDYSGIALDPADGTFWAYNEYAMLRGTLGIGTGDGRWGTVFGNFSILDYGDAPDTPYPTLLANNGARHIMDGVRYLGTAVDEEADGQPNVGATGDDLDTAGDDEDGVTFTSPVIVGYPATVDVVAAAPGLLQGWVDFNADGSWGGVGEQIFVDMPLVAGLNSLSFSVPPTASAVPLTYVRFRFSSVSGLSFAGLAPDGEVEDYAIQTFAADFGDAPDPTYPTLSASNGALHIWGQGPWLGASVDPEPDGQPQAMALGDDYDGNDDEDGVTFSALNVVGETTFVNVVATGPGLLNAWMDFNVDGDWNDPGEQIFTDMPLGNGPNNLVYTIPATALPTPMTFARFRFSNLAGLAPTGLAPDGEVEDYGLEIHGVDFGDAPDPTYATLRASNGARHILSTGPWLGSLVDHEADGQPTAAADGDDFGGGDDEDGVVLDTQMMPGATANLTVTATAPGLLDGWLDFNADGDWFDAGEQIFASQNLSAGSNNLVFPVPATAVPGLTYARFRFSSSGGLPPNGLAVDGEVEDHLANLVAPNSAPVAVADWYTTTEDIVFGVGAPGVLFNDTDADGDSLTAVPDNPPAHGVVDLQLDGSFTYTPTSHYNGLDHFTYHAFDGITGSLPITVTLTVSPANDLPVAVVETYTTTEDIPLVIAAVDGVLANDTDIDGDALTAVLDTPPGQGALTLQPDGSFVYTPTLNYAGLDAFTYHADDSVVDSNIVTVTLVMTPVNDAPLAVVDTYTTTVDAVFTEAAPGVLGNDSDVDGDGLTAVLDTAVSHGTLVLQLDGSFTYTSTLGFTGVDSFTYHATDGVADSAVVTVTLVVEEKWVLFLPAILW